MCLFQLLIWYAAVVLGSNSRFGGFNSRLGPNKFPFSRLRELARKGLTYLTVFGAKTAVFGDNRKNSRFHGKNREFRPTASAAHGRHGQLHEPIHRRGVGPAQHRDDVVFGIDPGQIAAGAAGVIAARRGARVETILGVEPPEIAVIAV